MKEGLVLFIIFLSVLIVLPGVINLCMIAQTTGMRISLKKILIRGLIFFICVLSGYLLFYFNSLYLNSPNFEKIIYILVLTGGLQLYLYFIGAGKYINKAKKKWRSESSQIPNSDFPQE